MKSSKRLATLSLIIMALVSTPRAMQQLRRSIDTAQERAGLVWWNLLLTPEAQATESAAAQAPCTQFIASRTTPASEPFTVTSAPSATSSARLATVKPKAKAQALTPQRRISSDAAAGPEMASNNYPAERVFEYVVAPAQAATRRATLQKLASHAGAQANPTWTPARIQSALASLNGHDAPVAPPDVHVVSDMETNRFPSTPEMNALMSVLAKKGLNVQFRMKKVLDRTQLPRPRVRTLISRDVKALPLSPDTGCECPAG